MNKFLVLLAVAAAICLTEAKRFDRCGLVQELRRQGFPNDKMSNWVCLVEHESARYTDKINTNRNKSKDYGLFQINDKYWCSNTGTPGKDCNVTCADLVTDDITKAAKCALKVFKRHGFTAWYGWKNHCQTPASLPDISSC